MLTRMVGLIAFGRPDNSIISPKVFKSMFKATYYTFCTLTTPATVTRSMGLPADARAVKFFAATLFKSTLTWQLRSIYRDLQKTRQPRHRRQLILTTEPLAFMQRAAIFVDNLLIVWQLRNPSQIAQMLTQQIEFTINRDKSCSFIGTKSSGFVHLVNKRNNGTKRTF